MSLGTGNRRQGGLFRANQEIRRQAAIPPIVAI